MNPTMKWLLDGRVLYWKLYGNVTQEQFKSGLNSINAILHEANQKIHVIVDANRANCLDGHTGQSRQLARTIANHGSMGCFLVITHNFLFKCQLNRVTVAFGTHLRYSDSFRNCWHSLQNIDGSLPYVAPKKPVLEHTLKYA